MFTGIIKYILSFTLDGSTLILLDVPPSIIDNVQIGSSVSVNGVCLTVTTINENSLTFFVMIETLTKTSLSNITYGKVNLELSLINGSSVDGHYVTGHVDTYGSVDEIKNNSDGSTDIWITHNTNTQLKYKDSISVDGISLTIAEVNNDKFRISIIPDTKIYTVIQYYVVGTTVNLEFNKYIKSDKINSEDEIIIKDDNYWMREAIKEGEKGRYVAHPNPWVGCVIVDPKTNTCISRGHHCGPGTPHGEIDALQSLKSKDLAEGSYVYTTLEPCHLYEGHDELLRERSGCDMKLIEAKVKRVIIGMLDADLRVINIGIDVLVEAGIKVDILNGDIAQDVKNSFAEYIESRDVVNPVNDDPDKYDTIESALQSLRNGEFIIVADEAERENEYDLVGVASACTEELMTFFLHYTTGKHCVVLSPERASHIGIKNMVPREENEGAQQTPFGMPIDSKACKTTGVDALDRCISVLTLANGGKDDYTLAGHTDTLISHPGGILARRGHTEASIALAGLLDIEAEDQAMLIGELMHRDLNGPKSGKMMRGADSKNLSKKYGLKMIHVSQLLDNLKPIVTTKIPLEIKDIDSENDKNTWSVSLNTRSVSLNAWSVSLYACKESPNYYHRVCVYGNINESNNTTKSDESVLVRIHSECWTGDCLGSTLCDCGRQLDKAKKLIIESGHGVIIFPANHEGRGIGLVNKLRAYNLQQNEGLDTYEANRRLGLGKDLRSYDDIPYILRSLGIVNVKLMSSNPDKISTLKEKMESMSHIKLSTMPQSKHVEHYLDTKNIHFNNILNNTVYDDINILFAISEYYESECRELMTRVKDEIQLQYNGNVTFDEIVAPGTREIPWYVKQRLIKKKYNGVFAIGITMKGGTNHNDIIATACTTGLMMLENQYNIPIPSSIISSPDMETVIDRTRGDKCTAKSVASTLLKAIYIQ